jgi:hypothetical protein
MFNNFRSFNQQIGFPPSWGEGVSRVESRDGRLPSDPPPDAAERARAESSRRSDEPAD